MQYFLSKDGVRYVLASHAAAIYGFNKDYVGRLARSGIVPSVREGRLWYVSEHAFKEYIVHQEYLHAKRNAELVERRKKEYKASKNLEPVLRSTAPDAPVNPVRHTLAKAAMRETQAYSLQVAPLYALNPVFDFLHKVASLVTACIIVFGAYGLFEIWTKQEILAAYRLTFPALVEVIFE